MAHYKGAASEAGRAMQLMKKRELALAEIELRKKKIEEEMKLSNIENKFAKHYDAVEAQLKSSTIGLVTLDEMKAKQETIVQERAKRLVQKEKEVEFEKQRQLEAKLEEKRRQQQKIKALSFIEDMVDSSDKEDEDEEVAAEEEEEASTSQPLPKKIKKNPDVDTSFLPDRARESEENFLREKLRQEWTDKQKFLKEEEISITFSYWDGSGHRRTIVMKKGNTIYQFLQKALEQLRREFGELKTIMADQLMYVKEDLILPHHYSFYDFIVAKARGKSGPLFTFGVHDDVRMVSDASLEKEDSHAGKVLLRSWYERNKHIFPASRWEPFDPLKTFAKYTIKDKTQKHEATQKN